MSGLPGLAWSAAIGAVAASGSPETGVEDRAAQRASPRRDDLRVIGSRGELLCVYHLPPGDASRDDRECQQQVAAKATDVGAHGDSRSAAERWLMESSSPTTRKLAS